MKKALIIVFVLLALGALSILTNAQTVEDDLEEMKKGMQKTVEKHKEQRIKQLREEEIRKIIKSLMTPTKAHRDDSQPTEFRCTIS